MTTSNCWKQNERFWARLHGETRSGPTGRDTPDITTVNCPIGVEHKTQGRRVVRTADMQQAEENAAKLGLPWALLLHTKGTARLKDDIVILPASTYLGLITGVLAWEVPDDVKELARDILS